MQQVDSALSKISKIKFELLVPKNRDLFFFSDLMEVIHIKLPDEGRKFSMFEIFWQNLILEPFSVFYDKAITLFSPLNDARISFIV